MRTKLSLGHVGKVMPLLDDHNKAALKAMRQARDYPANTCAGSRRADVDAVMMSVWALVRSGPNFDGRHVDVQRAVAAAVDNAMAAERERWLMLCEQALDALKYHQDQTRPIDRTTAAIAALSAMLGPCVHGGSNAS